MRQSHLCRNLFDNSRQKYVWAVIGLFAFLFYLAASLYLQSYAILHLCGEIVNPSPNRKAILDAFALALLTGCQILIANAKIHLSRQQIVSDVANCHEMSQCSQFPVDLIFTKRIMLLASCSLHF